MKRVRRIVYEQSPHNWAAYVPSLPGCVTTGASREETRTLIHEAIRFHLDGLRRDRRERPWLYHTTANTKAVNAG